MKHGQIKYRKCDKCGAVVYIVDSSPDGFLDDMTHMCTQPFPVRISGICGGSYSILSTRQEFKKQKNDT